MISILDIVKNLEDKLNSSLLEKSSENMLLDNGNESYKFKLFLDAGDYIGYDYFSDEMEKFQEEYPEVKFYDENNLKTVTVSENLQKEGWEWFTKKDMKTGFA